MLGINLLPDILLLRSGPAEPHVRLSSCLADQPCFSVRHHLLQSRPGIDSAWFSHAKAPER